MTEVKQTKALVLGGGELAALERAGSQFLVITPDEASAAARGPNPLDASRRVISARAGREQGRLLVESVKRFWLA